MNLYTNSFHIDEAIEPQFVAWLKSTAIPMMQANGLSNPKLFRITHPAQEGCKSFAVQLEITDYEQFEWWDCHSHHLMLADMTQHWGERAIAFESSMETVEI